MTKLETWSINTERHPTANFHRRDCCVIALTCIFWEADGERRFFDFLFEEILLVEEEDDGRIREPLVVADGVEQLKTLLHSVLRSESAL